MLSPIWRPYDGPLDSANNLCRFTDLAAGPGLGIVWVSAGTMYAIRKPYYDAQSQGEILAYEWGPIPPATTPPRSTGTGVRGWFAWIGGEVSAGRAAVGRTVSSVDSSLVRMWRNNFGMTAHQSDGVGVVFDAVGVGLSASRRAEARARARRSGTPRPLSLALMSFGPLELLGAVALIGGAALLVCDGVAYATEMAGSDEAARNIRHITFWPRCFATAMTLPDAVWGVGKVLLETGEMASKAASSLSTAERAAADAMRAGNEARGAADPLAASRKAAFSQKYAEIGAAAQRRAQARQLRLAAYIGAQGGGRAVIPPGIVFLVKEATDDPKNIPSIQNTLAR